MDFCDIVANSGKIAKLVYRNGCIYKVKNSQNKVYLTFDDGPTPGVTDWVLDTLSKFNVKATFFVLGKNVAMYPELFKRIKAEGHAVGNHTYGHLKGVNVSTQQYLEDIEKANQLIQSRLFRPPYGRVWPKQMKAVKEKGYKVVLWTVITCDYNKSLSPGRVYQIARERVKPGNIIVFHDSLKAERNMRYALWRVLEEFTGKFVFDKIEL